MNFLSSSTGTAFLLATSALCRTINFFPTGISTTSMLPSDADSTRSEEYTLSSELHYGKDRFLGKLDDSLKTLNNSLTIWQDDNYSTASPKSHVLSSEHYEEDSFSSTLDGDYFESLNSFSKLTEEYDENYPSLNTAEETTITAEETTITPEVSDTATFEANSATPKVSDTTPEASSATSEVSSTVSSTTSSQEQTFNQGLWSYSILGLTILGAAVIKLIKTFCSNEVQGESNEEMNMFNPSDFLTPVNNVTLELDNVTLMADVKEDTQA